MAAWAHGPSSFPLLSLPTIPGLSAEEAVKSIAPRTPGTPGTCATAGPLKGFVVGDYGIIYNTVDCGETWTCNTTFSDLDFRESFFLNSDTGFLVTTGAVFKTLDGGDSWIQLNFQGINSVFNGLVFADPDTGYIPSSSGRLIKTSDGGMTWNYIYTGYDEHNDYYNLNIPGHDTLYVVGYRHILRSPDQGATWEDIFTSQYSGGNLYFFSNDVGVYKLHNTVYHTKDAGMTWSDFEQAPDGWAYFINPETGYVLPGNGFLFHTADGGFSWESIYQFDLDPYDLFFTDKMTGYACSYLGTVYKSVDAGYTWAKTEIGTEQTLYFINFPDTSTGYTGGEGGMLLKYTAPLPVVIHENQTGDKSISVFPNPFNDYFRISFFLEQEDDVEITLFDPSGKLLYKLNYSKLSMGDHSLPVSGKFLIKGVYLVRYKSRNENEYVKIIKN